ncbi:MAG: lysophospholipid acyltransferase family protein [Candidatus Dormibacteraeota bacterium]|nr:lysophospholipid acyltransferase family protein [Candidatus Dormibacteraeota bacterium]
MPGAMTFLQESDPQGAVVSQDERAPRVPQGVRLDGGRSFTLRLTQAALRALVNLVAEGGLEVRGLEAVPKTDAILVCSNHLSNFDPLVFGAVFPRVMHAMAKAEMFSNPILRAYLLRCNCFPVRRGTPDRKALRAAALVLGSRGALVVFPEGHRGDASKLQPFEPGVGYIAKRSRALVVPCAIWGTEAVLPKGKLLPRRARIHLRIGGPFQPQGRSAGEVSDEIRDRVADLLPDAYR